MEQAFFSFEEIIMKIQVRTIKEREVSITDPITKKPYKYAQKR